MSGIIMFGVLSTIVLVSLVIYSVYASAKEKQIKDLIEEMKEEDSPVPSAIPQEEFAPWDDGEWENGRPKETVGFINVELAEALEESKKEKAPKKQKKSKSKSKPKSKSKKRK